MRKAKIIAVGLLAFIFVVAGLRFAFPVEAQNVEAVLGLAQTFTALNTFLVGLLTSRVDGIIYVDGVQYTTIASALAAASANSEIVVPPGTYTFSTGLTLPSGAWLDCSGVGATILNYTGTGVGLNYNFGTNTRVSGCTIQSSTASTIVEVSGSLVHFDHSNVLGEDSGNMVWVTGNGSSGLSNSIYLDNLKVGLGGATDFTGVGMRVDHVVDLFISNSQIFSQDNNITANDLIVDTGLSGLYVTNLSMGYGLHGLLIEDSTAGSGAYNEQPVFLFFDKLLADTTTGGDAIDFASTLSNLYVSAFFTNSWAAAAGLDASSNVVTGTANGIHISGGNGIDFQGRVRRNALNGVLIDNANANYISIHDSEILANNQNDTTGGTAGSGILITAASNDDSVTNNLIGDLMDPGGNQNYGIAVNSGVNSANLRIIGNDLTGNTLALLLPDAANFTAWSNLPGSQTNQLYGNAYVYTGGFLASGPVLEFVGNACTNGELALSGGWGSTAAITAAAGLGQTCEWKITASGTGQGANPTVTDTLTNVLPGATVVCEMHMVGGTGSATLINQTTLSATAPIFTFGGTPVMGDTYIVVRRCGP